MTNFNGSVAQGFPDLPIFRLWPEASDLLSPSVRVTIRLTGGVSGGLDLMLPALNYTQHPDLGLCPTLRVQGLFETGLTEDPTEVLGYL
jgi:hypothetical protein